MTDSRPLLRVLAVCKVSETRAEQETSDPSSLLITSAQKTKICQDVDGRSELRPLRSARQPLI